MCIFELVPHHLSGYPADTDLRTRNYNHVFHHSANPYRAWVDQKNVGGFETLAYAGEVR